MGSKIDPRCVGKIPAAENAINPLRISLFSIEMVINFAILFTATGFSVLLLKTKTFSLIPKILLINVLFSAYSIAFTRFFLISHALSDGWFLQNDTFLLKSIQTFHDCCINVNTFHQVALTIDGTLSSFFVNSYRQFSSLKFIPLITFLWPWSCSLILYVLEVSGIIETIPLFLAWEGLNVASWLMLTFLCIINRLRYKKLKAGNLSGKYQIIVNIRTIRSLNFLSILTSARNFITLAILTVIMVYYKPNCKYYEYLLASHAYDLLIAVYSLCLPLPLLLTHDQLRRHFFKIVLRRSSNQISSMHPRHNHPVINAIGENLIVYQGQTQYFRGLTASWETGERRASTVSPHCSNSLQEVDKRINSSFSN